jgi:hypothetical protein
MERSLPPSTSRAVSFHKAKEFVNIVGYKSVSLCDGRITISKAEY